jgi:U3 small nucleolar RNA-associated protein 6
MEIALIGRSPDLLENSALQLHPQSAILYILLSHHYLHPNHAPPISTSPFAQPHNATTTSFSLEGVSSARTTLLLGLRMLPADQDLWREYIKLEIGWVEALRRRWRALGIEAASGGPSGLKNVVRGEEEMEEDIQRGLPEPMTEEDVLDLGQNAFGAAGEPARKAIIRGDLIVTVIRSSLEQAALGSSVAYHVSLIRLLRSYPTGLRLSLLEVVYQHLATMSNCAAQRICADRMLYDREYRTDEEVLRRTTEERGFDLEDEEDEVVLDGEELVGALGKIVTSTKKTPEVLKDQEGSWNEVVGIWLLKWAGRVGDNEAMVSAVRWLERLSRVVADNSGVPANIPARCFGASSEVGR